MYASPEEEFLELPYLRARAICVTLVGKADAAAVYEAFGGRLSEAGPLTQRQCGALREGLPDQLPVPLVRIGTSATPSAPGGVFVVEDSSAEGARPAVLREVSRGTQAVALSLDPGDLPRLAWYRDGRLVAGMIANAPHRISGPRAADLEQVLSSMPGLRDHLAGVKRSAVLPAALKLAARLTGVTLTQGWTHRQLLGGIVLPVLDDAPEQDPPASLPNLTRQTVAALIEAASDSEVAAAVPRQAQRLADDANLHRWPEATALVDLLASTRPGAPAEGQAQPDHNPEESPALRLDVPVRLLIRRLSSSLHWHTVIDPSPNPEPTLRIVITALLALLGAAVAITQEDRPSPEAARIALRQLAFSRPTRVGSVATTDLATDLGVPTPGRQAAATDDAERDRTTRSQEALAAARDLAGRLPTDGMWAQPGWIAAVPGQSPGYCLILAADLSPDELLARVADGRSLRTVTGLEPARADTTTPRTTARLALGRIGSWSLAVEQGSAFILRPEVLSRVGVGTRLLCLQHDGALRLSYLEDGILLDQFTPLFPEQRAGVDPGRLDPYLAAAGRIDEVTAANVTQAAAVPFYVMEAIVGTPLGLAQPVNDSDTSAASTPAAATHLSAFLLTVVGPLPPRPTGPPATVEPITTPGGLTWWPRPGDPGRPVVTRITPHANAPRSGAIRAGRATAHNARGTQAPQR